MRVAATSPGTPEAPRSWKRQEGPSPGASGGSTALGHLDLRRLVSRTGGWMNFCFLQTPSLWSCVTGVQDTLIHDIIVSCLNKQGLPLGPRAPIFTQ